MKTENRRHGRGRAGRRARRTLQSATNPIRLRPATARSRSGRTGRRRPTLGAKGSRNAPFSTMNVNWTSAVIFPMITPCLTIQKARGRPIPLKIRRLRKRCKNLRPSSKRWKPMICRSKRCWPGMRKRANYRHCRELAEAELKIQQLEKTAAGEMKLRPLALTEE